MAQNIAGTFAGSASVGSLGQTSNILVIPSGVTSARLNLSGGIDSSNRIKTAKSTDNGQTWTDQGNYGTAQTDVAVTVAHGEHWKLFPFTSQAGKTISYSLSVES